MPERRNALPEEPRIRHAMPEDAAAIATVYTESILARDSTMDIDPITDRQALATLEGLGRREAILVLDSKREGILGYGLLKRYSPRAGYATTCETSVYIRRRLVGRRLGIGSRLQAALLSWARSLGYHHAVAKIWANNPVSLALHEKFGFRIVGIQREVGCVDGKWIDVALLECILSEPDPE